MVARLDPAIFLAGEENVGIDTDFTPGPPCWLLRVVGLQKGRPHSASMTDCLPDPKGLDDIAATPTSSPT